MKNQNFYLRAACLLVIAAAVLFYNGIVKDREQEAAVEELRTQVASLEEQQAELITAIQASYETRQQAADGQASSGTDENTGENGSGGTGAGSGTGTDGGNEDTGSGTGADGGSEDTGSGTGTGGDSGSSEGGFADGTYVGEGTGFGGTIQVQITLENQVLTDIQVLSASGEDSAYFSQAQAVITSVLDNQSTDVDAVSGATFSSNGILDAIDNALEKAAV